VKGAGSHEINGVEFKGIATSHDQNHGKERGANTVFCFTIDGIRVCHMGDLGHVLAKPEIEAIGKADLLLVPVGGFYTIDDSEASKIISSLNPRIAIPMHYRTEKSGQRLATLDSFLEGKSNVLRPVDNRFEIKQGGLPQTTQIVVLRHTR
jgi:L-ascorbate metabolism protein UlaG (beta-lactamase superfamily)